MKKKWNKLLTICMVLCLSMVQPVIADDCEHSWDSNGICLLCELECQHESKTWKSTGESEHSLICDTCNVSFAEESCTFDSNGECEKQCGNIKAEYEGCPHEQYERYYEDMYDGTHYIRCSNCTETLLKEEHNFFDNECICGAVKCYHDSDNYKYEPSDEYPDMHQVICADCDTKLWLDQCVYDDNNICEQCKATSPDAIEESCQHTGYTYWRYDEETQKHNHICGECYEILESKENHSMNEWSSIDSEEHYRMCTLGCDYNEREKHEYEETGYTCTVCRHISDERKEELLASLRSDAKAAVKTAFDEYSENYDVYGRQMEELYESTLYSIDQADDQDTLDQIVETACEALPEAALNDVKTDAYNAINEIVESQEHSEEFYNHVSDWINEISNCEDIESVRASLKDIVENKIPESEEPEVLCKGEKAISPEEGTYELYLDGTNAGYFTFEAVYGGWAIQDAEGYLTVKDGVLVHTDTPAAWEYQKGSFYQTVKTTDNGNKKSKGKKTITTYYYLTSATTVSTESVKAELYETVLATTHTYTAFENQKDGTHTRTCVACGGVETEECSYDEETGYCICGAYNPDLSSVTISATVTKESKNRKKSFYRATITTDVVGTTVKTVEYSTNGGMTWTMGSSFSSDKNIESFLVRVTDENGKVYNYTYTE